MKRNARPLHRTFHESRCVMHDMALTTTVQPDAPQFRRMSYN